MRHLTKRSFQTALVTGGLLMLGTGIASAQENVDPDRPASPIDGSITVPVDIGHNAIGTPGGQYDAPEHQGTYSSREITDPIKEEFEANLPEGDDPFRGNRLNADLVVPVQIANNAVGLLGDAEVSGSDHEQTYDGSNDVSTDGSGGSLAGNVVDADWAAPVQIANNALGLGGNASSSDNTASQQTTTGGDDTTDGSGGVLAGNVIAPQGATPVQVNNNAAAGGANADSSGNHAESDAASGGAIQTHGSDGVLSGNVAGLPVAFPVELNNGAYSGIGIADSSGNHNAATATAGGTQPGINGIDSYTQTDGQDGVGSGNIAQPQVAGDAAVHSVSGSLVGISTVGGDDSRAAGANSTETDSKAGGFSSTDGDGSVLGGNLADAPVAAPVEAYCIAGSVVGISSASCENTTAADSGGGTFTTGEDSTGGGNSVNAPLATTIESFGVAGTAVGTSDSTATEDKTVEAGGYNGTRGDESTGGGNLIQTPVAAPIETFGAGAAAAGDSSGTATETKEVSSGGDGSTNDDDATLAANLIAVPIAQPVQAFGIGGSAVGSGTGDGTSDTTTTAGGKYVARGTGGTLSGNIVQAASSAPAQAFGIGGSAVGDGTGTGDNTSTSSAGGKSTTNGSDSEGSGNVIAAANSLPVQAHSLGGSALGEGTGSAANVTESGAGGDNSTDGTGSSAGGNVIAAPIAGAVSLFGDSATALGHSTGDGTNDVVTGSGGNTETAGDDGSLAGNVISAQALPIAQAFGDAAAIGGDATGAGTGTTDAVSGGDSSTSGTDGSLSGNILDVPAAAVVQAFGDALAVGGDAQALGDNTTTGTVGGATETAGDNASGSGWTAALPVGAVVQIFSLEGPILGQALATTNNVTDIQVADEVAALNLPLDGSEMSIDGLPSFDGLPSVEEFMAAPAEPLRSERSELPDVSPALQPRPIGAPAAGMPEVPGLDSLGGLPVLPQDLADVPAVAVPLPAPALPSNPSTLPAPALPGAALPLPLPAPSVPEVATTLPAPAASSVQEAGLRGMWAKFIGFLTNKPMHIEG